MQWDEWDDDQNDTAAALSFGISALAMPVRVEVSLSGTPWEFRARLLEAGVDYCVLTLVSPCAPALRRGAEALLYVGTLAAGEIAFAATISDVAPRPTGLTIRCAVKRVQDSEHLWQHQIAAAARHTA